MQALGTWTPVVSLHCLGLKPLNSPFNLRLQTNLTAQSARECSKSEVTFPDFERVGEKDFGLFVTAGICFKITLISSTSPPSLNLTSISGSIHNSGRRLCERVNPLRDMHSEKLNPWSEDAGSKRMEIVDKSSQIFLKIAENTMLIFQEM